MDYTKEKEGNKPYEEHPIEDSANTSNFKCLSFIISDVSATINL